MRIKTLALLCASLLALPAASALAAEVTVVRAGKVIVDAREAPLGVATVVVREGRIVAVERGHDFQPTLAEGDTLREIDLGDATLMPGLIDSHVHLSHDPSRVWWQTMVTTIEASTVTAVRNAATTVRAGFTTVRDLGAPRGVAYAVRDAVAAGQIPGPRILSAGTMLSIVGGHGDANAFRPEVASALDAGNTCTGPVECARRVREMSRAGADVIKLAATGGVLSQGNRGLDQHFSDEELKSIVDTARLLGLRVTAHAHGPRGVEAAARAGVNSIEHGTYVDERGIAAMRAAGTVLVPTMSPTIPYRERIGTGFYSPSVEGKIRERLAVAGNNIRAARKAGLTIAFGTDAGVSEHGRNAEEFPLMLEAGMTAREALVSATIHAADLLGLENETGRIEPGLAADLIAVPGDPLADVTVLQRPRFVMAAGRVVREDS
jgi:imidazolonepropionase-like amidohydrolase